MTNRKRGASDDTEDGFTIPGAEVEVRDDDRATVTWPDGQSCVVGDVAQHPDAARDAALAWKAARD